MLTPPEDFWSRRANAPRHQFRFVAWGMPVEVAAHQPGLLAAAQRSARRFGQDDGRRTVPPAYVQIIGQAAPAGEPPADWPAALRYAGAGEWISLSAGAWGHGVGRLDERQALIVLTPALAAQTQLISRFFIDHYVLNFLFRDWAMLHASAVLDPAGRVLVALLGDHDAGKSTTALRLLRAGWHFLADGMLLFQPRADHLAAAGYPIGEVKLRDDALARFPEYAGDPLTVREQRKTVVDLRAAHPDAVVTTTVTPAVLHVCLTERRAGQPHTTLAPLPEAEARAALAAHTVYWDEPERLRTQTRSLEHLLTLAACHRLTLGADPAGVLTTLETLR